MPGLFLTIFMGVFSMAPGVEKMAALPYIPVLNVCVALRKLFSQQNNYGEYAIALGMTIALSAGLTWLSTRLLDRESTLFRV